MNTSTTTLDPEPVGHSIKTSPHHGRFNRKKKAELWRFRYWAVCITVTRDGLYEDDRICRSHNPLWRTHPSLQRDAPCGRPIRSATCAANLRHRQRRSLPSDARAFAPCIERLNPIFFLRTALINRFVLSLAAHVAEMSITSQTQKSFLRSTPHRR